MPSIENHADPDPKHGEDGLWRAAKWMLRYGSAIASVVVAYWWRLAMERAIGGTLPLFITWYPMVMGVALFGGLGPGLLATATTVVVVAYWVLPPFGLSIALPEERLAVVLFAGIGVAISVVAELYRRSRHRSAIIERELALRASDEALRAATDRERFLANVLEQASQAFGSGTPDGKIGRVNRAFELLTGYSADELRSIDWVNVLTPPEWRAHESQKLDELNRTGIPVRYEKEFIRKDGTRVPVELFVHVVKHPNGRPEHYFSFISDISERRQAQETLRSINAELMTANADLLESRRAALELMNDALGARKEAERAVIELAETEARFRTHVENSGLAVIEWDASLIVTHWAGEAERMFGWSAVETVGVSIGSLNIVYEPDSPIVQDVAAKLADGTTRQLVSSNRNVTKDGRVIHCRWYNSVQLDAEGRMASVFSLVQDYTAQVEAEAAVREINETLERRVAERTAEVSHLADELRALAAELTQAELRERKRLASILHDHVQQLLVAAQMQLALITRANVRALPSAVDGIQSIISEAIAASRSLTVELSPPILHQSGLAAGLSWLAARMEEKHGFSVRVRSDRSAEPTDESLRILLFESVRELLLNAVKHSGERHAEVVMLRTPNRWTRVVVEDSGLGFDPTVIQARRATGGFGLFSIQQRLAHVGGRLEIESAPGKGTRAILMTPLPQVSLSDVEMPDGPSPTFEPDALRVRAKGRPIRVLLADDHQLVRAGLINLLQFAPDIEVVGEAADGRQAVELARGFKPDVIVMDINMPEMDGVQATEVIVRELPATKVIGLTMHGSPDVGMELLKAGAVGCLTKGGPTEELVAAIRACGNGDRALDSSSGVAAIAADDGKT
jgi:PAS domain S-box-containing protein